MSRPPRDPMPERLQTAQDRLDRMLETIAPYSRPPVETEDEPMRWVSVEKALRETK